jgi:hypothetical protein
MKRLAQALLWVLALWAMPAMAQVPCAGVGGVNTVPQIGVACSQEPAVTTYGATGVGIVPAAAATDIACISPSAAGIVLRVQAIRVNGSGTAISIPVLIRKNASLDSGGTLGTGTVLPVAYALDSNNATSKSVLASYTANPTVNDVAPGIIDSGNLGLVATTVGAGVQPFLIFDYTERNYSQAPLMRKTTEQICVNLNGTTPTALLNVSFKWTESLQ